MSKLAVTAWALLCVLAALLEARMPEPRLSLIVLDLGLAALPLAVYADESRRP